jgi:hypothetical protein
MSHPTHNTRYSDSSHYDERCILCGATDAPGSNGLYLPCREYRAEEIAPSDPSPTGPERAGLPVDVETVVGRVLLALMRIVWTGSSSPTGMSSPTPSETLSQATSCRSRTG